MSWRADKRTRTERGYSNKWLRARAVFLREHPMCVMCRKDGRLTIATVVDHIIPHKGNDELFWDEANWQPLCKRHHDSDKKRIEAGTQKQAIGIDGWPVG